eukprot:10609052-Alexandrium_andersonii.AAC.1
MDQGGVKFNHVLPDNSRLRKLVFVLPRAQGLFHCVGGQKVGPRVLSPLVAVVLAKCHRGQFRGGTPRLGSTLGYVPPACSPPT